MSRYEYDGDTTMPYELWVANLRRALKGKRGQQALRDLREALLALPEPRLIEGALCTVGMEQRAAAHPEEWYRDYMLRELQEHGEGVCAIGAYLWHQKVRAGEDPAGAFGSLPTLSGDESDLHDTASLAVRDAGIAYTLAWEIAYRNDEKWGDLSPEERHAAFLAWIDAELAAPAEATEPPP